MLLFFFTPKTFTPHLLFCGHKVLRKFIFVNFVHRKRNEYCTRVDNLSYRFWSRQNK